MGTLHVVKDNNLADIPAKLRKLATRIEKGDLEDAFRCVVVVRSLKGPVVLGFGCSADATHAFADLHIGASYLLNMLKSD